MSGIREALKARGLDGSDLESMIDTFLAVSAMQLFESHKGDPVTLRTEKLRRVYGSNTVRLASALHAIGKDVRGER